MNTILLASNNAHKLKEIRAILPDFRILSLSEAGLDIDPDETGATFYENALIKAKALYEVCKLPIIADDSGLCVDALDGAPGVFSARYSGGTDADNNQKLLRALDGVANRTAYFESCIVYYDGIKSIAATGRTFGRIAMEAHGEGGFGYDPLFMSDDLGKTFGEASETEKNGVSHRARALAELAEKLRDDI